MKKRKALALFSGGLDSALAIKVVQEQGIDVIALNFVSHFFGGTNPKSEFMAKQLGIPLEYIHFEKRHMGVLTNPVYGYGKNMNPCIDCHSLMFKIAGELLPKYDADFVISGEVLGQRPMSQNYNALEKVKKLSGMDDLVLRPLSAKLLPPSLPERMGWVDKEKLLDIQGRSRKRQMELVESYGITEYPSPAGGCLLTDPAYSDRLKILREDGFLEDEFSPLFYLIKHSRFFRLDKGKYIFVGRIHEENEKITSLQDFGSYYLYSKTTPGPRIIGFGDLKKDEKKLAKNLFLRYSRSKGKYEVEVITKSSDESNEIVENVELVDLVELEKQIKKYQIVG